MLRVLPDVSLAVRLARRAYGANLVTTAPEGDTLNLFLIGPTVSGCEAVTGSDIVFAPPESGCVTSMTKLNDFNVLVRANWTWTHLSVSCRGRQFPACDRIPSNSTLNTTDWRDKVPWVPYQPLPVVYFTVAVHLAVFAIVVWFAVWRRRQVSKYHGPDPEPLMSTLTNPTKFSARG